MIVNETIHILIGFLCIYLIGVVVTWIGLKHLQRNTFKPTLINILKNTCISLTSWFFWILLIIWLQRNKVK